MATIVSVPGCTFCEIIAGRLPSSVLYRDEVVMAFLDIRPITTGHLLVVPCSHAARLADLPEQTGGPMFATAQRLASALLASAVPCDGINFFLADGTAAGQEVDHVHLHVLPRFAGDGFKLSYRFESPGREALDATAELVREALAYVPG